LFQLEADQKTIVEQMNKAMTMHDVSAFLTVACRRWIAALGDVLARAQVTTPGLPGIRAECCGIGDLTPHKPEGMSHFRGGLIEES